MEASLKSQLNDLLAKWKRETITRLSKAVKSKNLIKTEELIRSLKNIKIDIVGDEVRIEFAIAPQGRFQDMKRLGKRRNKKRWGYASIISRAVAELRDEITILLSKFSRELILNTFRQS